MAKAERSIFTDVVLDVGAAMKDFQEFFRGQMPASFMHEKETPRQFKQSHGVGIREWQAMERQHGKETMDSLTGRQ